MDHKLFIALLVSCFAACEAGDISTAGMADTHSDGSQLGGDVSVDAGANFDASSRDPETVADGLGCGSTLDSLTISCVPGTADCTVTATVRDCGVPRTIFAQTSETDTVWCENGDCLTL